MPAAVSACYSPTVPAGAPCDPLANNCPAGQQCVMTASGPYCGGPYAYASIDAHVDAPPGCDGVGIVDNICSMILPMTDVTIATDRIVDTSMAGGNNCDQIITLGGAPVCLIAGASITIQSSATLTGIGPNP